MICYVFFIQDSAKRRRRELIKVEDKFKGKVKGKEAAKLRHISAQSGAKVVLDREDQEIYIISGTEEEREHAKALIGEIVVGKRSLSLVKIYSSCFTSTIYKKETFTFIRRSWGAGGGGVRRCTRVSAVPVICLSAWNKLLIGHTL